jgi:Mn-dependent DtxR family transcriptional regulator
VERGGIAVAVTRRTVLERLATASDAERRETTTPASLAAALGTDESTVTSHLNALAACELARMESDGRVRVTITGEEFLALPVEEVTIVDPEASPGE